jgi:hypothetical protein
MTYKRPDPKKWRNDMDAIPVAGDELIKFTEDDRQVLLEAAKELKRAGLSQLAGRLDRLARRVPAGFYPDDDDW